MLPEIYSTMYIRTSGRRFIPLDPSTPLGLYFIYAYFPHLQITILYAYCLCDLRYTTQLYLIYGHVLYGTPAFIQQKEETGGGCYRACMVCCVYRHAYVNDKNTLTQIQDLQVKKKRARAF
jgi:hypothetical protein